jgi:hypothetical protein
MRLLLALVLVARSHAHPPPTMCDVEMYVREKCVMYVREKWSAGLAGLLGNCCSGYYL